MFIISNVVAQPLVNKDSFKTAIGVIILSLSIILISKLSLRKTFYGIDSRPSVLIANGIICSEELKKNNLNLYVLLSMLRIQGFYKVSDINFALLEPGGQLSVLPKASARPATSQEVNLNLPEDGLTYAVIIDGTLNQNILPTASITEQWLLDELHKMNIRNIKEVFYAEVDTNKTIFVNLMKDSRK